MNKKAKLSDSLDSLLYAYGHGVIGYAGTFVTGKNAVELTAQIYKFQKFVIAQRELRANAMIAAECIRELVTELPIDNKEAAREFRSKAWLAAHADRAFAETEKNGPGMGFIKTQTLETYTPPGADFLVRLNSYLSHEAIPAIGDPLDRPWNPDETP